MSAEKPILGHKDTLEEHEGTYCPGPEVVAGFALGLSKVCIGIYSQMQLVVNCFMISQNVGLKKLGLDK